MSRIALILITSLLTIDLVGQTPPAFRVIAFFTARNDQAHISFVKEANQWFSQKAARHNFVYDTTRTWSNLNAGFLANYQLVIFLDSRPDNPVNRAAFETYMNQGGAWLGFHFAGFALTPSEFPQNWDWYHNEFLGAGQYQSNKWRPTSAVLRVERPHPVTKNLPPTFQSAPSEWYRWQYDLRKNPDMEILLAIDSTSFPVGTGPKPDEIWHSGYYPVVWTNKQYRMVYFNMGHNDIDYENNNNQTLSSTFSSEAQNQLLMQTLLWLSSNRK